MVVFNDDIENIQLGEGRFYIIINSLRVRNVGMNLRDGQTNFEFLLDEHSFIKPMFYVSFKPMFSVSFASLLCFLIVTVFFLFLERNFQK